ncbi:hypothetical protein [Flavimarina sp. Hel_I_48]|uniref:hypothetical protein n=1 Tax=Flavimarina sp. Hel_I_48 TaxID=1392488 RepID=UPI0004DECFBB|nr:hypothetical protein [Flavimarina sp. Hel_I_48]
MVVKCNGINIQNFKISPFELIEGEILGICIDGGNHFQNLERELINILTQQKINPAVQIKKGFLFADRFEEGKFKSIFAPTTVKQYLKRNGGNISNKSFFNDSDITNSQRLIKNLPIYSRKLLEISAVFNKTNYIIFDLLGQNPNNASQILKHVKNKIKAGGAAILIDNSEYSPIECTNYVRAEIA